MSERPGWESCTNGKDDIKCTLQADHGNAEGRGCENTTGMPTLAKTTLNVPYWLTTQMGPRSKRWSYWVVILILILIKHLAKSFVIIIMWHVLSKPMAL